MYPLTTAAVDIVSETLVTPAGRPLVECHVHAHLSQPFGINFAENCCFSFPAPASRKSDEKSRSDDQSRRERSALTSTSAVGQWVEVISSVPGVVSMMKAARPGSRVAVQDGRLSIGIVKTDEAGEKEYHSNRLDAFRVKFVGRAPRT